MREGLFLRLFSRFEVLIFFVTLPVSSLVLVPLQGLHLCTRNESTMVEDLLTGFAEAINATIHFGHEVPGLLAQRSADVGLCHLTGNA